MTARRPPAPLDPEAVARARAPFGRSRMLPRGAYVDQAVLDWEATYLFDGGWVCAGRTQGLESPGDQRAVTVGTTGVLLVRGVDDSLRAFANICRHRGHELLAREEQLNRKLVLCPYHAWTYALDGSLNRAPDFDADNFDEREMSLISLPVVEWGGWAWVNVDGQADPFLEQLGTLAPLVEPWGCERLVVGAAHRYELQANWKIAVENYNECYHCPLIHPELCRVSPHDSGEDRYGSGAWVGGSMDLADHASTMSLDGRSSGRTIDTLDGDLRRQVLYLAVLPNLLLSLHPDYVMTHRLEPLAPNRTSVECQWLFPADVAAEPGFDPSYAVDFWDLTNRQDWGAIESVQRGLSSPRFVPGVLADQESDVYRFVSMMAAAYAGDPLTGP